MTATETEIQPTTTGLEDLEFEIPCGRHGKVDGEWRPTCEHPATWFAVLGCCGHTFLVCDMHQSHGEWICLRCECQRAKVIRWERL
jgi:hypothetical protein